MGSRKEKRKIFLSGFMGAGKSRIGRTLRDKTGFTFYDSDRVIEESAGKSISRIFEEDGEEAFREMEKQTIKDLCDRGGTVIVALGGGAVLNEENRRVMREHGYIIYLKSSPEAIYERVKHKTHRPLLQTSNPGNSKNEILQKINSLMMQREEAYKEADLIIERDGMEAEEIADIIMDFLSGK